jgi:hypothetical protein
VSAAFRITIALGATAIALALLLGPAWRGSFYRSWLRPRLVAFGIVIVLVAAGSYIYRVINAVAKH